MPTASDPSSPLPPDALVLALDAASPTVSVAVGRAGAPLAVRSIELRRSSERLLALIDDVLVEAGASFPDVAAMVALAGPGSFTGLRVGLATVLGCNQATGVRATAVPTLPVLALAAGLESGIVWAAVDAIRGEWFCQPFELLPEQAPRALAEPELLSASDLVTRASGPVVGFGAAKLGAARPLEPRELATAALRHVALAPPAWDPARLARPLYLRAPEATVPLPRLPLGAPA